MCALWYCVKGRQIYFSDVSRCTERILVYLRTSLCPCKFFMTFRSNYRYQFKSKTENNNTSAVVSSTCECTRVLPGEFYFLLACAFESRETDACTSSAGWEKAHAWPCSIDHVVDPNPRGKFRLHTCSRRRWS